MIVNSLLFLSLVTTAPGDSNWQKWYDFRQYARQFTHTGVPYIFGKDKSFEFAVYEGDTIPRSVKLKYFMPQWKSINFEYGQKSYYICPFYNDSVAGLIYKVHHGTGVAFVLILYDLKIFRPIESMQLFWLEESGAWCEGIIDSGLTITQSCYYYDNWWDHEKRVLKKAGTNKFRITTKGFEVLEGKKVDDIFW